MKRFLSKFSQKSSSETSLGRYFAKLNRRRTSNSIPSTSTDKKSMLAKPASSRTESKVRSSTRTTSFRFVDSESDPESIRDLPAVFLPTICNVTCCVPPPRNRNPNGNLENPASLPLSAQQIAQMRIRFDQNATPTATFQKPGLISLCRMVGANFDKSALRRVAKKIPNQFTFTYLLFSHQPNFTGRLTSCQTHCSKGRISFGFRTSAFGFISAPSASSCSPHK